VEASHHAGCAVVNPIYGEMRANTVNPVSEASSDQDPAVVASARPAAGRIFEGARPVRLGDVRPSGRLRLDAVVRYLQDVSADDTADAALPDDQGWVVRRTRVEVRRAPRYLERLRLATWCSGTGSHYAGRRVEVRGEGGAEVDADTLWVHVDLATGRPRRLSPDFFERYGEAAAGRKVKARLHHAGPPADAPREPWPLRTTDLDVLGHVNNAAYWEVVEEALARHGGVRGPIRAELEHHRAAEPGHLVEWVEHADEAGGLSVWVLADGAVAASARVEPLEG
jgi:acyl-ACP thioesterase